MSGPVACVLQVIANHTLEVIELAVGDEDGSVGSIVLVTDIEELDAGSLSCQAFEGQLDVKASSMLGKLSNSTCRPSPSSIPAACCASRATSATPRISPIWRCNAAPCWGRFCGGGFGGPSPPDPGYRYGSVSVTPSRMKCRRSPSGSSAMGVRVPCDVRRSTRASRRRSSAPRASSEYPSPELSGVHG